MYLLLFSASYALFLIIWLFHCNLVWSGLSGVVFLGRCHILCRLLFLVESLVGSFFLKRFVVFLCPIAGGLSIEINLVCGWNISLYKVWYCAHAFIDYFPIR